MKEKLITRLVMGALVGLAAAGAYAGQIQSSSVSIAREVITSDSQPVTSPRIAYRFAGDVDARSQIQTFQVQFILAGGAKWASAGVASNIVVSDGVTGTVIQQSAAAVAGAIRYHVDQLALSSDSTTLYATISVFQDAVSLIKQPIIAISGDTVVANNPTVKNLKTVVGTVVACDTAVKTLPVSVQHFVALSAPNSLAVGGTGGNASADEHLRAGAQNTTTLIAFPTNILVGVTSAKGGTISITPGSFTTFQGAGVANVWGVAGTAWQPYIGANLAILGNVYLTQNAVGYDTDLAHQYLLTGNAVGTGVNAKDTATLNNGNVEATALTVKVSATQGFAPGGSLFLSTAANCGAAVAAASGTVALTSTNAAGPITLSITSGDAQLDLGTSGTGPIAICYAPSGAVIPGSSFNVDEVRLVKAAAGADLNEQDNFCSGPLLSLTGSVKIDVRNYANSKDPAGWTSVIRVINNSEVRAVDVYGQIIQADGSYGPWGKLISSLKPRAVAQWNAKQIDALLTNAPNATVNGSSTPIIEKDATGGQSSGRLRITSPNASTLRVQNYLYNPTNGTFIEASSSEAVDFDFSTNRAPLSEGQYQTQDAEAGLNGGN